MDLLVSVARLALTVVQDAKGASVGVISLNLVLVFHSLHDVRFLVVLLETVAPAVHMLLTLL